MLMNFNTSGGAGFRRTRPVRGWGRPAGRILAGLLLLPILLLGLWKAAEMAGGLL